MEVTHRHSVKIQVCQGGYILRCCIKGDVVTVLSWGEVLENKKKIIQTSMCVCVCVWVSVCVRVCVCVCVCLFACVRHPSWAVDAMQSLGEGADSVAVKNVKKWRRVQSAYLCENSSAMIACCSAFQAWGGWWRPHRGGRMRESLELKLHWFLFCVCVCVWDRACVCETERHTLHEEK